MCLNKEAASRDKEEMAQVQVPVRPISRSAGAAAAMPNSIRQNQAQVQRPTQAIATTNTNTVDDNITAQMKTPATTTTIATKPKIPATKPKSAVIVSQPPQEQDAGLRNRRATIPLPSRHHQHQNKGRPRQHSSPNPVSPKPHQTPAAIPTPDDSEDEESESEMELDSLHLTLCRSGSVTYATTPRMSRGSFAGSGGRPGMEGRTKTRERIVVIDGSGRRREYFR
jgi:hypothetical protein